MKRFVVFAIIPLTTLLLIFGCSAVDSYFNRHLDNDEALHDVTPEVRAMHQQFNVVDMHSDALMWRHLTDDRERGHVSAERVVAGSMALQVLAMNSVLTTSKTNGCYEPLACGWDVAGVKMMFDYASPSLLYASDCYGRLVKQANSFRKIFRDKKDYRIVPIKTSADIDRLMLMRREHPETFGLLLSLEGAHGLGESGINASMAKVRLNALHDDYNLSMIGLTHRFDNAFGGSSEGCSGRGLSRTGEAVIKEAFKRGIAVDVAHGSRLLEKDVTRLGFIYDKPIFVSHTGLYTTRREPRNITDENVMRVALTGGVVGLGLWRLVLPKVDDNGDFSQMLEGVTDNFVHAVTILDSERMHCAVEALGIEDYDPYDHIGLGADYDGLTTVVIRPDNFVQLTNALHRRGIPSDKIKKLMGGNTLRALRKALSEDASSKAQIEARTRLYNDGNISHCFRL